MKTVHVISKGCIYEGGGVYGVFLREDLANAKFEEMLEYERESNRHMEEYTLQQIAEHGSSLSQPGEWLEEKEIIEDDRREIIFHGSQYLNITHYECEE